jgi:hypothetical protein
MKSEQIQFITINNENDDDNNGEECEQEGMEIMYHVSLFNNEKCENGMLDIYALERAKRRKAVAEAGCGVERGDDEIPPDPSIYSMFAFMLLSTIF